MIAGAELQLRFRLTNPNEPGRLMAYAFHADP
jgi:hypothetical protein